MVRDRDDHDLVWLCEVDDRVREALEHASADVGSSGPDWPCFGHLANPPNAIIDQRGEAERVFVGSLAVPDRSGLVFGQGLGVTPMQMVAGYAAIANGGILRRPQVIERIGEEPVHEPRGRRVIDSTVAEQVRTMLEGVLAPGGTASEVSVPGYTLAGKTGTAQVAENGTYSETKYIASFIGFAPAQDPRLLVAVIVDEPQGEIYGGSVAAPAFGKIAAFALPYLGVPQE